MKNVAAPQNNTTHQLPSTKVNVINHFFLLEIWIRHTKGIGSAKTRKSVATVIPPKAIILPLKLMQYPGVSRSHSKDVGTHRKIATKRAAMNHIRLKDPVAINAFLNHC